MRTFVHPKVWGSMALLLREGRRARGGEPRGLGEERPRRLPLFLVLGTNAEPPSPSYDLPGTQPPPEPALLARALTALEPTRVRIFSAPQPVSCDHQVATLARALSLETTLHGAS